MKLVEVEEVVLNPVQMDAKYKIFKKGQTVVDLVSLPYYLRRPSRNCHCRAMLQEAGVR